MNDIFIPKNVYLFSCRHAGDGEINGSVKFKDGNNDINIPFCKVDIYDQQRKLFIFTKTSNQNGTYSFPNLNLKDFKYFVVAHHKKGELNGAFADNIGGANVDS